MQGRLREEPVEFSVSTECAHCGQPIHLELNRRLNCRVLEPDAKPLVFVPHVDFSRLSKPSIIDDF